MPAIWELKRNWTTYQMWKLILVTEDMCSVTTDSTKWVSPYNTSYWYTNITISADSGITWVEWYSYRFEILTKLVVASAYRNVRIRIWSWNRMPVKNRANSILAWNSYFVKWRTDFYVFRTAYESDWALHLQANSDTTYSVMSVAEWKTATATSSRIVRSDYLKQIIEYHAGNLDNNKVDKITGTATLDRAYIAKADWTQSNYNVSQWASSNAIVRRSWTQIVVPETPTDNTHATSKKYVDDAVASAGAWNMNCITNFWRTRRFWTKTMFNALAEKDVNGVYVILSERDYQKMIND